jgi:arabinogalactan endo-1,4-beta-galactosidase
MNCKNQKPIDVNYFMNKSLLVIFLFVAALTSCKKKTQDIDPVVLLTEIKACDMSFLPGIRSGGVLVKNQEGKPEDMLITLQNAGMNTVRLRLWNNPADGSSGLAEVKALSQEIKSMGMHVWLTVHYSDTWADPGSQTKPEKWKNLPFSQLRDSVYAFTQKIVTEMHPDFIQIGNEINNGLLWPDGSISNLNQMTSLLAAGIAAVRDTDTSTKIILHYAGFENAEPFFVKMKNLDYDMIGLSYYPLWHGKQLDKLETSLAALSARFDKKILIAETSYPFTFDWNDYTNNVIGSQDQILSDYPATAEGQKNFLLKIREIVKQSPKGFGFAYWGGEWISFKGNTAIDGSSWENQAFWDFSNKALPVIDAFAD